MDSLATQSKKCKLYKKNRFRFVYVMKRSGESCYRCTVKTCTAKLLDATEVGDAFAFDIMPEADPDERITLFANYIHFICVCRVILVRDSFTKRRR